MAIIKDGKLLQPKYFWLSMFVRFLQGIGLSLVSSAAKG